MQGIYYYLDKQTNNIVYIGKDSYIDKQKRFKAHLSKHNYSAQKINQILQNNPNRYDYKILEKGNMSQKLLKAFEMCFIFKYNPKFNFTVGGEGSLGKKRKFSEAHKEKLSKKALGNKNHLGKCLSQPSKNQISLTKSKQSNTTGYYRVYKNKTTRTKQGFIWVYRYPDEEGKRHKLSSINLDTLEEKVKQAGLLWKQL